MSIHNPSVQADHHSSVSTFPAEELRSPDHHSTATTFDDELANQALEGIHTKLYGPLNAPFFTYNTVPWTLHVRKEVKNFLRFLFLLVSICFISFCYVFFFNSFKNHSLDYMFQ